MILTGLTRYRELGLLLLRIGLGAAFIAHGWPKLVGGPAYWAQLGHSMDTLGIHVAYPFWGLMAAVAEFGGGVFVLLGLLFRPACILLVLDLLVALSQHLWNRDFPPVLRNYGPGWSHPMELAIVFLCLLLIGPGKYSIDRR